MEISKARILIVDDDYDVLKSALVLLQRFYSDVQIEQVPENVIRKIEKERFDLILLDMNFQKGKRDGEEGFHWLSQILESDKDAVVVMITAYGDVDLAVRAIRTGAVDFVLKPWKNQKLLATINAALEIKNTRKEVRKLKITQKGLIEESSRLLPIIGESEALKECLEMTEKVAKTDANILITGENGTGKELIARNIHRLSERKDNPFISVDLGSIAESLFESELFGHVKGAFTDAREDRVGRFELAGGGSIFLDEIGNLNLGLQAKLLTAIQNKTIIRVGSTIEVPVDFRLISATNKSPEDMVNNNQFREDLLYRIKTVEIKVPALRERREDIDLLFHHFLGIYSRKYNKSGLKAGPKTLKQLRMYDWPGNIRELQHIVERAVILSEEKELYSEDIIPERITQEGSTKREITDLEEMEKQHVENIINKNRGNKTRAAMDLGISRTALHRRIRKYGI
ncbi:sigma-54-dependent transcriptional regulator [Bacteroidota bacterium]